MSSVRGRATAEQWGTGSDGQRRIERLLREGFLTEADAYEIEETLSLIARRVHEGSISQHFAELVIEKLANDKFESWSRRASQ